MRFRPSSAVVLVLASGLSASPGSAAEQPDVSALYTEHCAECHGASRLGGIGPALLPENLTRLRKTAATAAIAEGRPATQMPAFADTLTADQIGVLVDLIYTPLPEIPRWSLEEIEASHVVHTPLAALPDKPAYAADPLNLFTVVEAGDHHVTILDGDTFEPLWRFPSRFSLHGGAKYSPDGRFLYLGSRDGWISKYDLYGLTPVAEVRAGINTRNIAVSGDGKWVMVGNFLPHTLVVLDAADLRPVKVIPVDDGNGTTSRVSAVYTAPPRSSFVAALKDIPEIWEMSYAENPKPVAKGLVHNYEPGMTEGFFDDPRLVEWVADRAPLRRAGEPHELDGALLFLASAASSYVTGQTLSVDAGWSAA